MFAANIIKTVLGERLLYNLAVFWVTYDSGFETY